MSADQTPVPKEQDLVNLSPAAFARLYLRIRVGEGRIIPSSDRDLAVDIACMLGAPLPPFTGRLVVEAVRALNG